MATKFPQQQQQQQAGQQSQAIPPTTSAIATEPLNDTYARQFGEWIAGEVKRIAGWDTSLPDLDTNRSTLLGKLAYDAVVQFQHQGHFPVDVSMYGADDPHNLLQESQSGIVNQYGSHLASGTSVDDVGP